MTPSSRVVIRVSERDRVTRTPPSWTCPRGTASGLSSAQTLFGSRNLAAEDFPGYVETVPSGVVELVVRQAEGWYYLRP